MQKNLETSELRALPAGGASVLLSDTAVSQIFTVSSSPEATARLHGVPECLGGCGEEYTRAL